MIEFLCTLFIASFTFVLITDIFSKAKCLCLLNKLKKIQRKIICSINQNRALDIIGVDRLCIQVNEKLIPIADPDTRGKLLPKIGDLRKKTVECLGFIIPNIRIHDNTKLIDFEYTILVNGTVVDGGFVYPNKIMISKLECDKLDISLPEDCIKAINPIDKTEVYWINESDIETNKKCLKIDPTDVIINHLEKIVIKNSNEIMSHSDVKKYIKLVNTQNPELTENFSHDLLSITDLKTIFTNLITEKISIKDIISVFEYLNDFARFSQNPDELSEKLRYALRRQIQQKYVHDNKVYAITFSQDTEKQLETLINHSSDGKRTDFKPIAHVILEVLNNLEEKIIPVVLVSSKIRLQLYRYLNELIPSINVISYNELSQKTHIEILKEISNEHHKIYN